MLGDYAWYMFYRVFSLFPQSAPVEPSDDVKVLIDESGLSQRHIANMYKIFLKLHRAEVLKSYHRFRTNAISSDSVINIVSDYREFVVGLLHHILQLGGSFEYLDWNHFVYIVIRFCSLTKVELSQLLFLIIVRDSRGLDVHYLTSTQLDRFYEQYRHSSCPVSMDCTKIHFSNFPLSRYYITDFVEVCFLYSQLINPLVYLQNEFRVSLPNLQFWENSYRNPHLIGNRKIGTDFFLIKKLNVVLIESTQSQFQESTDLLLLSSEIIHHKLAQRGGHIGPGGWGSLFNPVPAEEDGRERALELAFLSDSRSQKRKNKSAIVEIYSKIPPTSLIKN